MEMETSNLYFYLREALEERINQIREQIQNTESTYDREKLE